MTNYFRYKSFTIYSYYRKTHNLTNL